MAITGRYGKKTYRKRARRPRAKKTGISTAVKKYVKSTLNREIENKHWYVYNTNIPLLSANTSTNLGPNHQNLIPKLTQGVTDTTRIGNDIHIKKGRIHGYVNLMPYDGVLNPHCVPLLVKCWLVTCKSNNLWDANDATNYSAFFDTGGSTTGFQNNPLDMVFSPNPAIWKVHKTSQFKIGASNASGVVMSANSYFDNSPMTHYFNFDYTKYLKKKVLYDDNLSQCTNQNLYLIWQVVPADGTSNNSRSAEIHYHIEVQFQDS